MKCGYVVFAITFTAFKKLTVTGLRQVGCGGATLETDAILFQKGSALFEWLASETLALLQRMGFLMDGTLFPNIVRLAT